MKNRHMRPLPCLAAVSLIASGAVHSAVIDWVAGRDMAANEAQITEDGNPNPLVPQWSYGYRSALESTSITLYTNGQHTNNAGGNPTLQGFAGPSDLGMFVNTGASDVVLNYNFGKLEPVNPQEILSGPGSGNQFSILRWTATSSGLYDISAYWDDIDPYGGDGISGHVVVNGVAVFNQSTTNNGANIVYNASSLSLNAGDIVDFALGANSAYQFDSTALDATITLVPEPSVPLIAAACAAAGLIRRRKA